MRKIFSLLAAVLFAGSMMAQTTYTFTALETPAEAVAAGLTFTFAKNSGSTNPAWNATSSEARLYAKGSLTITSSSTMITKVVYDYVVNQNSKGKFPTIDGVAGATNAGTWTEETKTWENAIGDTEITLSTSGDAGNLGFKSITITFAGGGDVPSVATPVISGEAEFTDSVIVTMTCSTQDADIYYTTDGTTDPKCDCAAAPEYKKPIVLKETTTIMAAAYTGNDWSAVATKTFTKKEPLVAISCAEVYSKAKGDELALNNVVVTYANAKNVYVQDETGSMLLYLTKNTTWEAGNILSGVQGTLDIYNGLYEVKMTEAQATAVQPGQGEAPAPVEFTKAPVAADMNKYVVLKGVTVPASKFPSNKNMNCTIGDETFVLRNNFNADVAFDSTKVYDITGVVSLYNSTVQVYFINATEAAAPEVEAIVYNWAKDATDQIGTTVFGGNSNITTGTVKIHENTDDVNGIKFGSSYVYADGKYIAIKPAEGGFKAGDELNISVVFNNSDPTKYCMADVYAADGAKRLFRSDSVSTLNGRNAGEPIVQTYVLESDQDSLLLGRYGNTGMFITLLNVVRKSEVVPPTPVELTFDFKIEKNILTITPSNDDPWAGMAFPMATFVEDFEGNLNACAALLADMIEPVPGKKTLDLKTLDPEEFEPGTHCIFIAWGNVGGVVTTVDSTSFDVPVISAPTNCAEAAEAALSVSKNNELYNDSAVYTIEGYVTSIATAFNPEYNNVSFWMADTQNGGNVIQAYRAVCTSAEAAPAVGDKVAVTGCLTKYNSTPEFAAKCTYEIIEKSTIVPQNLGEKTIAEFLELKNTIDTCILTGVVDSITNDTYGNLYLSDATAQLYVYGVLTPAGESKKFAELGVDAGDTLTVLAIYNEYQGAPQAKNAIFVEVKKAPEIKPDSIVLVFDTTNTTYAFVDNQYYIEYGTTDLILTDININTTTNRFEGDGKYLVLDFYAEDPNDITGTYTIADETLDIEYTYMLEINGTDTAEVEFVSGEVEIAVGRVNKDSQIAEITAAGLLISTEGDVYAITAEIVAYYDFLPEEGVENVVVDPKAIKRIECGQIVIEKNGVKYNAAGALIR